MAEVKRVKLLDQHNEMMGRGQGKGKDSRAGANSLRKMMSIDSIDDLEQKQNDSKQEAPSTSDDSELRRTLLINSCKKEDPSVSKQKNETFKSYIIKKD